MVEEEVERDEEETAEEAVKMYGVVGTETISSARTKMKIGTTITRQLNPSSMRTAPSETKVSPEKMAAEEDVEAIAVAQAEEAEVVNAGLEVVETREAGNIIREIEL